MLRTSSETSQATATDRSVLQIICGRNQETDCRATGPSLRRSIPIYLVVAYSATGRGEPFCWFLNGRLDEYGIATLELGRGFLNDRVFREPQRFGIDVSDERVYGILDSAKKKLMVT